jgi:hypothetical protein
LGGQCGAAVPAAFAGKMPALRFQSRWPSRRIVFNSSWAFEKAHGEKNALPVATTNRLLSKKGERHQAFGAHACAKAIDPSVIEKTQK